MIAYGRVGALIVITAGPVLFTNSVSLERLWIFRASQIVALVILALLCVPQISHADYNDYINDVRHPTKTPKIKGCSSRQKKILKKAWSKAHSFVWRAKHFIDGIYYWPSNEREQLWNRDHIDAEYSVSPRTWFGRYSEDRLNKVREAFIKAERRFRRKGAVKILRLNCGQRYTGASRGVDSCRVAPSLVGRDTIAGYHFPAGHIYTCENFWRSFGNQFVDDEIKAADAAQTLVHEVFHWLSVDGRYMTDYHGDGFGGITDQSYDLESRSRELARRDPKRATRNVSSYSNFARNVGTPYPHATALWRTKSGGTVGKTSYALALTWNNLLDLHSLRKDTMSLMDVETYVRSGKRRYTGLWYKDSGRTGALWRFNSQRKFMDKWRQLRATQDLIDIEVYKSGDHLSYLGVWRKKASSDRDKVGAIHFNLDWNGLARKWSTEISSAQHLVDIESYLNIDGVRKFAGLWQVKRTRSNADRGQLFGFSSAEEFEDKRIELQDTHYLLDMERYFENGHESYIGIWRRSNITGRMFHSRLLKPVELEINRRKFDSRLIDIDYDVDLPQRLR